jgi:DNA invertase Pin-like site-specific DNA recombinase
MALASRPRIASAESEGFPNGDSECASRAVYRLTTSVVTEHTRMAQGKFVAYYRVSTQRQGRSGLGLEAQRAAVMGFLIGGDWQLVDEFTEVESGAHDDRPKLAEAMKACRLKGATLVIAKLDRLSRDAVFLLNLQKGSIPFVAADMPSANEMTVGLMAVIAQGERRMISDRTKAALTAVKARGKSLGGWRGGPKVDGRLGAAAMQKRAQAFASDLGPILTEMRGRGRSLRQMAAELTAQGIRTPRGGQWTAAAARAVLLRIDGNNSALTATARKRLTSADPVAV